ncbi:MAG: acyl carrier protein [Paludibacteraceae bacterium]|nr:acyl carrier protein [Paludibacteraceae bacterium]
MTKQQIIEQTNAFFIHTLDFEETQITPEAELRRDLGITSVDAVAIATFVQKTFGIPIVMRELKAIITLEDLYNYIETNH